MTMLFCEPSNIFRGASLDYNVKVMKCKNKNKLEDKELVKKISEIIYDETTIHPSDSIRFRKREYVESRQLLAVMLLNHTKWGQAKIGWYSGEKDHATVINSRKAINNRYDTETLFREMYNRIDKRVKQLI